LPSPFQIRGNSRSNSLARPQRSVIAALAMSLMTMFSGNLSAQERAPAQSADIFHGPGHLLQAQPLAGAPEGATAYKIYYQSTGLHGEPITVSGMVIVPPGPVPSGGRPVVAWAHPTTGVVPRCAPSLARKRFQMIAGLKLMIARGFVVAATDYPGLGTPETHPYLVGESEGRAVLDSIRAARQIPDAAAGARFVVWGHSQGGQAALFTGLLAAGYAPDLQILGVAAAAPATELANLMKADLDTNGGRNLTAMTLWSWNRVFGAPMDAVLDPSAVPVVDRLAGECIESIYDILVRRQTTKPLAQAFLRNDGFASTEPWASLLRENTPGMLPTHIPVFIAQGTTDNLVLPRITRDYVRRLCRQGSRVSFDPVPNTGHGFIAFKASDAAIAWIGARFAGLQAPSNCGRGAL
jgi:pimeloyl-ACP methyl ester carboxylesterase